MYDPEIPLLGIYVKNMKTEIWKDKCMPMFIAALFTKTKIGKYPKYTLINEWIKKLWDVYMYMGCYITYTRIHICMQHTYNGIVVGYKKEWILPFTTTWRNLGDVRLKEVRQRKYHMILLICEI